MNYFTRCLPGGILLVAALLWSGNLSANAQSAYSVSINTAGLSGTAGRLTFDLVGQNSVNPHNTITISQFATDGRLAAGGNANQGGATGDLSGPVTLSNTAYFNESARGETFGNQISFNLNLSENYVGPASPDQFSFFLLDSTGQQSVVSTSDASGANALFTVDITGQKGGNVTVFDISTPGVSVSVGAPVVPAPSSLPLFAGGLTIALIATRRNRSDNRKER